MPLLSVPQIYSQFEAQYFVLLIEFIIIIYSFSRPLPSPLPFYHHSHHRHHHHHLPKALLECKLHEEGPFLYPQQGVPGP